MVPKEELEHQLERQQGQHSRSELFDALGDISTAASLALLGEYLEGLEAEA